MAILCMSGLITPPWRRRSVSGVVTSGWIIATWSPTVRFSSCAIAVINVEVVKYIAKYVFKGPDQATVQLTLTNEIQGYLEGRHVGPSDATRGLLKYRTHEEYPPVHSLMAHLPGQQPARYPAEASADEIRSLMDGTRTPLISWRTLTTMRLR
ncbi:hypothetical protein N7535_003493 [Penicillium sp. DV-2018c]|nr:hypothetical protein N7461_000805 [Penicillium sp. DV-2018c]KAJ5576567.1 hypothetical protein N7535_003493 [Penicillium sp. DV-2018c]